jgi:hypothetical protein
MRCYINYITKLEFLLAFKAAFYKAFTASNICLGFRATRLVPFNLDAVLLELNVVVRTPSPPALPEPTWVDQTPTNTRELDAQSSLLRARIQRHHSSSPASILESLGRLTKGTKMVMHTAALLKAQVADLKEANQAATKRKARKRKRIQKHGSLTGAEGAELAAQIAAREQLEDERRQEAAQSGQGKRAKTRCSKCKELGHNSRTCKKDTVDTD